MPDDLASSVGLGSRVRVSLHGRRVGGWVVEDDVVSDVTATLKPIAKSSGLGPDADVLSLCEWAAHRWCSGRLRPLLVTASPPVVVHRAGTPRRTTVVAEPSSPATTSLIERGGGVLRLPPTADQLPAILSAARVGPTLVVCPSVDGARALAARLRRTAVSVALVPDDWAQARGGVDVVIGARQAAFAPCPDLAVALLLDEHDEALQEERTPTWHARDVLVERARRAGAVFVAVSPTPSAMVRHERFVLAPPVEREAAAWPEVVAVDRRAVEPWKRSLVSDELIAELRDHARRVACVVNTKGQARLVACRQCRELARCESCGASVAEITEGTLTCASCSTSRATLCAACGSTAMARVKPGTARLRAEIEAAAHRSVMEVTGSSTFDDTSCDVFVGTEAVLHRVRRIDTVVFLDFDAELLAPRYRAAEQAMSLLVRAGRLVGPRGRGGKVLVQTTLVDHDVITSAVTGDPAVAAERETVRRRDLSLPPFSALALVEGDDAESFTTRLGSDVMVARHGEGFLVRASSPDVLADAVARAERPAGVRIEVDPPRV